MSAQAAYTIGEASDEAEGWVLLGPEGDWDGEVGFRGSPVSSCSRGSIIFPIPLCLIQCLPLKLHLAQYLTFQDSERLSVTATQSLIQMEWISF